MTDKLWKQTERSIADIVNGKRVPVHSTSGVKSDVDHEWLAIEVKERKELPDWLMEAMSQSKGNAKNGQLAVAILHQKGKRYKEAIVCINLDQFMQWFGGNKGVTHDT